MRTEAIYPARVKLEPCLLSFAFGRILLWGKISLSPKVFKFIFWKCNKAIPTIFFFELPKSEIILQPSFELSKSEIIFPTPNMQMFCSFCCLNTTQQYKTKLLSWRTPEGNPNLWKTSHGSTKSAVSNTISRPGSHVGEAGRFVSAAAGTEPPMASRNVQLFCSGRTPAARREDGAAIPRRRTTAHKGAFQLHNATPPFLSYVSVPLQKVSRGVFCARISAFPAFSLIPTQSCPSPLRSWTARAVSPWKSPANTQHHWEDTRN